MERRLKSILVLALPYALTVLLPIISVLCLGSMVMTSYHEKIITDKQKSIEFAFDRFLQRIDNIQTLSSMIAQNDIVIEYAYASLRSSNHSLQKNMEMRDLLSGFLINNDVTAMYLYDPSNDRIITTDAVLSNAADYFKYRYCKEGYTAQECVEQLKAKSWGCEFSSSINAKIDDKFMEVIEYRISVPLNRINRNQPHLTLVMKAEDIFGDFYEILDEGGEFYIYDNKDRLILGNGSRYGDVTSSSKDSELKPIYADGEKIYQMTCYSDNKLWKVHIYMPDLMKSGNTETISPSVWLLMAVPVIVSLAFCMYFTFRNHREIQEVLQLFRGRPKEKGEPEEEAVGYKAIREYANQIIRDNDRFKERIINYESIHKYEVLDRVLRNTYENREEMEHALEGTDLCIRDDQCVVLCIRYEDNGYRTFVTENLSIKDLVKELLAESTERKYEIFDTSARETICVLAIGDDESMELIIRDMISGLNVEIAYNYGIKMKIGVGNVVESIYHIHDSYAKAKEVIRYSETSGNKVLFYLELAQSEDVYYYPREFDDKIYNYAIAGRAEEAKAIIQSLYKENFEQRSRMLSVRAIEILKNRLRDSLISISGKYDVCIDDAVVQLDREQNVKNYFDFVYDSIDLITEEIKDKKKSLQNHTVVKMMDYIQENYSDNALSLKQISLKFGFHETYISRLFKAEYGENLSGIIEKLRIEKACELIKNTDIKIGDIAEKVGYTSDLSFRRAFKKVTGMNPGEYRENS
ncbi:MAG: helix-turn-helix domain-containing protein [Lachnospiraceae bacterium]|nr:helix-turn-helix domain-containing protein [Lachnospiraceae bacterium]